MMYTQNGNAAKPFVKWVGGKGQLLPHFETLLPYELHEKEFTYIEPFVGGGAMLFFILQKYPNIRKVIINDINTNLTDAYHTIKYESKELICRLKDLEKQYLSIGEHDKRQHFYLEMRRQFNEEKLDKLGKTVLFIFLNRTCFNGLYRENAKGLFNVPFGRYAHPKICNEEVIIADSELLNRFDVQILNGDFTQVITHIDSEGLNFLYFDPPYRPLSTTSNFNHYVKEKFDDNRQRDLADLCYRLNAADNVKWMLSNADCSSKNPEDTFFEEIYGEFNLQRVYASRMVNANANKRGKLTELLIRNYAS